MKVLMLGNRGPDFNDLLQGSPLGQFLVPSIAQKFEQNPIITYGDSLGSIGEFLVKVEVGSNQPVETAIPKYEREIRNRNFPFH